jgi:hypothetical protein
VERAARVFSMPDSSFMKNGSTPSVEAGRAMTRPRAPAREADRARAALLGRQPMSAASLRTRWRVASETPGRPLRA